MKYPSEYNKNILTLITLYFKYRKFHTYGYMKYSYFRNVIMSITTLQPCQIRRSFDYMVKNGLIEKRKISKSTYYRFDPYKEKYEEKITYKVIFD
tara:strand:- start:3528 stop:3812 length:285 start_codon:yes stop_codon:yes gene_type:complete